MDPSGNVWVAGTSQVAELNPSTGAWATFGSYGSGAEQFYDLQGISEDASGNVWVADTGNNRIDEFTPVIVNGVGSIATWKTFGVGAPHGIAADASGSVWVTSGNQLEMLKSSTGAWVDTFGSFGNGGAEFNNPQGVATDISGDLFVADAGNNRIYQFVPGCTASVTALYNGAALSGAYVYLRPSGDGPLWDYWKSNVTIYGPTDANGNISLYPSVINGAAYDVMVRKPSAYHYVCGGLRCGPIYYGPPVAGDDVWLNRGHITLSAGRNVALVANTTAYSGGQGTTISGTVASGGKPMIGWYVRAAAGPFEPLYYYGQSISFPNQNSALIKSVATTDANGSYTLTLPDQTASYYITACSSAACCQWWDYEGGYGTGSGGTAEAVSVSAGQQETGADINIP